MVIRWLFAQIKAADLLSDIQNASGVDAELVKTHAQESFCQRGIRAELAADADPAVVLVGCLYGHLNHSENRGMLRIIERVELTLLLSAVTRRSLVAQ